MIFFVIKKILKAASGASGINNNMETMKFGEPEASQDKASPASSGASQGGNNSDAPQGGGRSSDQKRRRKLIWAGIVLATLILAVIGWQYWQYTQSPYYQQMKAVKAIEKDLKEQDKWGGKTPEETVRLFTEAVKKGDFELASKYGRDEIKSELEKMKVDRKIDSLIKDLEAGKIEEGETGPEFADLIVLEASKKYWILSMVKSDGGTWKIVEF